MSEGFKVEAADYHRNGVGGEGFNVAIVNDDEYGRMLVIDFNMLDDDGKPYPGTYGYAVALNLDEAAKGNIYMHAAYDEDGEPVAGTGNNAWRGADHFAPRYRQAIEDFRDEQYQRVLRSLNKKREG